MRSLQVVLVVSLACSSCDGRVITEPRAASVPTAAIDEAAAPVDRARVATAAEPAPAGMALDALPWEERIGLEQALAENDARHAPRMDETGPVLETPGSVMATFTASGAHLSLGAHDMTLAVVAVGRDGAMRPTASSTPEVHGAEVRTARGAGIREWWRSLPSGLEHGVTIEERSPGEGDLWVEVAVDGDLSARSISDDAVELLDAAGARVATYAHLIVLDAAGTRVPARMTMDGARIALVIEDASARYPLVIDPFVTAEEAMLLAPDGAADDLFGYAVAITPDGTRALVGVGGDDTAGGADAGSARVFRRTGSTWVQEATLLAPDGAARDALGGSVALTSDGSRALVGASLDDTAGGVDAGSARVFLRTGTAWAQEATLRAPDGEAGDHFGSSVALTSDGSRALVGAQYDTTAGGGAAGSARVFLRTGTAWAPEATLLAADGASDDFLGASVALTSDGTRAVVGAHADDTVRGIDAGSVRVFLRTGFAWAEEAAVLAPDGAEGDQFGFSVALDSDGSRALVGAPGDDTTGGEDAGSARVLLRVGSAWAEEATLLASDAAASDGFGNSVALAPSGGRALVAVLSDHTAGGNRVRVLLRAGTSWAEEATLIAPDGAAGDIFGNALAISSDGSRALVAAYQDGTVAGPNAGSVRVFTIALAPNGSTCSGDGVCASGFCTDGVCCGTRCGGGTSDCQACSAALTGGASGTCAPLSAALAVTVTCRAAVGLCDPAETCTSTSTACPVDARLPSGTSCRPSLGGCDPAETCDGTSGVCPTDIITAAGTVCRAATTGGCDVGEVCDGASASCPGDTFAGAGTVCRSIAGACDLEEVCSGSSPLCPADAIRDASVVCRPPLSSCDLAESCSGAGPICPVDLFAPATTLCGTAPSGECDAADHCSGTSADCERVFLEGVVCRASVGACDAPEICGSAPDCPADLVLATGLSCRASTDTSCDPEETCDGVSIGCPADVTTCMSSPDVGPTVDAAPDAGAPPPPTAGCGCGIGSRHGFELPMAISLLLLGLFRRLSRR